LSFPCPFAGCLFPLPNCLKMLFVCPRPFLQGNVLFWYSVILQLLPTSHLHFPLPGSITIPAFCLPCALHQSFEYSFPPVLLLFSLFLPSFHPSLFSPFVFPEYAHESCESEMIFTRWPFTVCYELFAVPSPAPSPTCGLAVLSTCPVYYLSACASHNHLAFFASCLFKSTHCFDELAFFF